MNRCPGGMPEAPERGSRLSQQPGLRQGGVPSSPPPPLGTPEKKKEEELKSVWSQSHIDPVDCRGIPGRVA